MRPYTPAVYVPGAGFVTMSDRNHTVPKSSSAADSPTTVQSGAWMRR